MPLDQAQEIRYSRFGMYPFNWILEAKLLSSVYPVDISYLHYLRTEEGITLAINLAEDPWPEEWSRGTGIRHLHFPVTDMSTPDPKSVRRIIEAIDSNEGGVMVHCAAGIGRTGTLMGLYLVDHGMGPEEAIRTVRQKRPGSIQTRSQERMIMSWKGSGR